MMYTSWPNLIGFMLYGLSIFAAFLGLIVSLIDITELPKNKMPTWKLVSFGIAPWLLLGSALLIMGIIP